MIKPSKEEVQAMWAEADDNHCKLLDFIGTTYKTSGGTIIALIQGLIAMASRQTVNDKELTKEIVKELILHDTEAMFDAHFDDLCEEEQQAHITQHLQRGREIRDIIESVATIIGDPDDDPPSSSSVH